MEVVCKLEGQDHKIVELVPEGTLVKPGDVVIRLDPAQINDRLATQQIKVMQADALAKAAVEELKIQRNLAESKIAQAELALKLAELDKKKFLEGEYQASVSDLQGSIALARADLQEANDVVDFYRDLVEKGFRTPEQQRAKAQAVERAEYMLARDEERLKVLEKFTRERQEVELTAKAMEAHRELERAKSSAAAVVTKAQTDLDVAEATARLEREQLQRIQKQLGHCEVAADVAGAVVYSKDKTNRIESGATVHYKQKLFSVPDMSKLQVRAWVHESEVRKIAPGLRSVIHVDALPGKQLHGTVRGISTFYDNTRHWLSGGVKEYAAIIRIEDAIGAALIPGMTSQVTIHVGQLTDSLIVPLAAVTESDGHFYAFVVDESGVAIRPVSNRRPYGRLRRNQGRSEGRETRRPGRATAGDRGGGAGRSAENRQEHRRCGASR